MKPLTGEDGSTASGRPFTGAWIETAGAGEEADDRAGRPFTGAWIETRRVRTGAMRRGSPLHGGVD